MSVERVEDKREDMASDDRYKSCQGPGADSPALEQSRACYVEKGITSTRLYFH